MKNSLAALLIVCLPATAWAGNVEHPDDPHYTASGFFDIHVCNWPDRPAFYLALYSTSEYGNIASIEIRNAAGDTIGSLDLDRYLSFRKPGKPEKRVFIEHLPIPGENADGWFGANIVLKNGEHHEARDFVIHQLLGQVTGHVPVHDAVDIPAPEVLSWTPVDGAAWYQVSVRDMWQDRKLIHTSRLIPTTHYRIPQGLLEPGGSYEWKVHARDVDGHLQLGDFNIGSQSRWIGFSVAED